MKDWLSVILVYGLLFGLPIGLSLWPEPRPPEPELVCVSESIPYESEEVETDNLDLYETDTVEGVEGEREVCTIDGEVTSNRVLTTPTNEKVYVGTYEEPYYEEPVYSERSGAECNDGTYSDATGSGACSWHGGVYEWLY